MATTKKTAEEIKKEVSETASKIAEAGKTKAAEAGAAVKKTTAAAKETAKKTTAAAKKTATAAKKPAAAAKKPAAKKTASSAKKAAVESAFIQDDYGNSKTFDEVIAAAKANFKETHKRVAINEINVYIKAAENKVYYVVNGDNDLKGDMNLF